MLFKLEFENPEKKPLSELYFHIKEDGVQLTIPALSERWVEPRCYTKYPGLGIQNGQIKNQAAIDEWLSESNWFNKDLEYLLGLEHFRFWSHLLYARQCMESIISFLQEAIPYYIPLITVTKDEKIVEVYGKILRNVLTIICRIITNKESETEWITKDHLKELLYSKFLMSVPMMFDLVTAYGPSNIGIITKIIQTIFKIEPKYKNDLKLSFQFLQKAFKIIQKKAENEGVADKNEPASSYDDLALYALDCASTISFFLEVYPDARKICCDIHLDQSITNFYDNTIPLLYKNIFTIDPSSNSLDHLNNARIELLKSFRATTYLYIENVLNYPKQSMENAEHFIAILTECLADRTFVIDYQKLYPVEIDMDILKKACRDLDSFKSNFVLKAYTTESEVYFKEMLDNQVFDQEPEENFEDCAAAVTPQNEIPISPPTAAPRNVEQEVKSVLDILPHLGDGFIRRLLTRYDNPESAIAAILESNLPPDLSGADQNETYIPPDPQDLVYLQTGVRHINVYDGDGYDIMTHDKPKGTLKIGKGFPGQPKNLKQLLNDKSHVRELKERYQEYGLVDDNEYDDEYDDSYDALAESESRTNKSKAVKEILVDEVDDTEEDSSDEEESTTNNDTNRNRNMNFCENPEVIRARYEAQRNAKFSNRSKPPRNAEVAGKPKGQGQEKNVVNNRKNKEAHKSSRANHNRKSGASWKRNKGMIPS